MDKLEKVIKAWECCNPFNRRCFECPYDADCFHDNFDRVAIADMVILLKEQQEKIDGLLEELATAIDDKDSALLMLKEQDRGKHGHWKVLQNCSNSGVYCSECNTKMFDRYPMKKKFSQYCGHCGSHNDLQVEVR